MASIVYQVNGLVSTSSEVNNYLRANKSDIIGLVEIKLSDSEEIAMQNNFSYIWNNCNTRMRMPPHMYETSCFMKYRE